MVVLNTARARLVATSLPGHHCIHSSACLHRGIAVGGSGRVSSSSEGGSPSQGQPLFASLRHQMDVDARKFPDVSSPAAPQSSSVPFQASSQQQQQHQTSAQARFDALKTDAQNLRPLEGRPHKTGKATSALGATGNTPKVREMPPTGLWQTLSERIKEGQQKEFLSYAARARRLDASLDRPSSSSSSSDGPLARSFLSENPREASPDNGHQQRSNVTNIASSPTKVDALPSWSLSTSNRVERTYGFQDGLAARMFLQGASSRLLMEPGWVGSLALERTKEGTESIKVWLGGSRGADEEELPDGGLTEHDVVLGQSLDRLAKSNGALGASNNSGGRKSNAANSSSNTQIKSGRAPPSPSAATPPPLVNPRVSAATSPLPPPSPSSAAARRSVLSSAPRSSAFTSRSLGQAWASADVLGTATAEDDIVGGENLDERVPVAVQGEQVPSGSDQEAGHAPTGTKDEAGVDKTKPEKDTDDSPTQDVLSTTETEEPEPIEDSVPVPNLDGERQGKGEGQ